MPIRGAFRLGTGAGSFAPTPPSGAPDVVVRGNGADIANGDSAPSSPDHTTFVTATQSAGGTTRTFTVFNTGTALLTTTSLTAPTGFTITEGLSGSIAPGGSDSFTVRLDDATVGVKSGNISFGTNVSGKNPYTFAVSGEVAAPAGSDWFNWAGTFTAIDETRRNLSGSAKTNAPYTALLTWHPGEVTTSHWFDADIAGTPLATNAWQLGERVTHPDGSLAAAVLRAVIPGSWTNNTDKTVTLTRRAGSWPAETDSRAVSIVTAASDFWIEFDDITEPENRPNYNFGSFRAQQAWTHPTLEYRNNRALGLATAYKRTAGGVFSQWVGYEMVRTPGGATADTQLSVLCFTETWYSPGTDTVIHQAVHPLVFNGKANVRAYAKAAKVRVMNGATVMHNYSNVETLTMADWNFRSGPGEWEFTDAATDFANFKVRFGDAVKVAGTLPSNLVSGNMYATTKAVDFGEWSGSGRAGEITQLPGLGLGWFGVWNFKGSNKATGFNNLPPGTGGGTHTLTTYTFFTGRTAHAIRDPNGDQFWTVGGAVVEPNWSRAQKIRRMQTGQIPSIPLEEFPENEPPGTFLGLTGNGRKNTSLIPAYQQNHTFAPGRCLFHRTNLNDEGVYYQQGNHLNECSLLMSDVLLDMANTTTNFWRIQKIAAAESISMQDICAIDANLVGGQITHRVICLNNGPAKNGVAFPGMGPCQPNGTRSNSNGAALIEPGGETSTQYQQNEILLPGNGGTTGSHNTKEFAFGYALRAYPTDLIACHHMWTLIASQLPTTYAQPLFGRNKTHAGINYYMIAMLATMDLAQPRRFIGWNYMLSFCLYTPDSEPEGAYFKEVAADNVRCFAALLKDSAVFSAVARILGPVQSGSGNQAWILGRHSHAASILLKRSGITGSDAEIVLKHLTAMPRAVWGAPEGGGAVHSQATGANGYTGYTGFVGGLRMFDKGLTPNDSTSADPRSCSYRFLADASSVGDSSMMAFGLDGGNETVQFNTNNTITFINLSSLMSGASHFPVEGDSIVFARNASPFPPTEVTDAERLWLYDFSGTTCKLSTTPGPSWTQKTWTLGSPSTSQRNNHTLVHQTRRAGAYAGGLVGINQAIAQTNQEYLYEIFAAVPAAKTMFGASHVDAALVKHAAFRTLAQDVTQNSRNYYNRAWNNGSWAWTLEYGPGAT